MLLPTVMLHGCVQVDQDDVDLQIYMLCGHAVQLIQKQVAMPEFLKRADCSAEYM